MENIPTMEQTNLYYNHIDFFAVPRQRLFIESIQFYLIVN